MGDRSVYLTVQEVAERMRCEHRTVRRAIRSGQLEAAMIGGKWLIRDQAVDEWFDARRATGEGPRARHAPAARRTRSASGAGPGSVARLKAIEGRTG